MICDCHAHLIGPPPHDPEWPHWTPEASLRDYLRTLDTNGVAKGVLVQPFAAGFDNGLIGEALARHPERLRGVAVVSADVSVATLHDLHRAGFRGVRFGSKMPVSKFPELAPRLARAGLHLQLRMGTDELVAARQEIADCPVPVVIDHLAHPDPPEGMNGAGVRTLQDLLSLGHVFAKLSAVFRWAQAPDWSDARDIVKGLIDRHSARLVWGSDWPFLNRSAPGPTYAALLRFVRECAGTKGADVVLSRSPRVLYGF